MEDLLKLLTSLLLDPYRQVIRAFNLDLEPLFFAYMLCFTLLLIAAILRVLKLRKLCKAVAFIAFILAIPPLLVSVAPTLRFTILVLSGPVFMGDLFSFLP